MDNSENIQLQSRRLTPILGRRHGIPAGRGMGYKEGDQGSKSGPIYTDFRRRGAECTPSIPKIVEKGRKCSAPIEAPGAQTRKCSTQAPSDSQGLGYKEGDQGSKSGPIYTNFRRRGSECTPLRLR